MFMVMCLFFREQMLLNIRARQTVREKKKVSKKPEMPMIIAAEVRYLIILYGFAESCILIG